MAVVLTIDFEAYRFDDNSWFAFSVGICTYPMGCILDSLTRILKIPLENFDEPRKHFWQIMHPESYAYLQRQGEDPANREVYEKELVQFEGYFILKIDFFSLCSLAMKIEAKIEVINFVCSN
jgi:hypothetical protein